MKTMKFVSLSLFAILCCKSYAHENMQNVSVGGRALDSSHVTNDSKMSDAPQVKIEKRYVDSSNIRFDQRKMYVQLDQNWVVTSAVYTDADGFYILETKGGWTCGTCGWYNENSYWTCENCGRRRED